MSILSEHIPRTPLPAKEQDRLRKQRDVELSRRRLFAEEERLTSRRASAISRQRMDEARREVLRRLESADGQTAADIAGATGLPLAHVGNALGVLRRRGKADRYRSQERVHRVRHGRPCTVSTTVYRWTAVREA